MSFFKGAQEFFGLTPADETTDEAYYDDRRYSDDGAAAYKPRYPDEDRYAAAPTAPVTREPARPRSYSPSVVTAAPQSYEDAREIGEPFRDGDAVIFELTHVSKGDAKRFIDFSAGLCFAAHGQMFNLSKGIDGDRLVFAVVPQGADITRSELQVAAHLR